MIRAIAEPIVEAVALVVFIGGLWGCLVILAAMGDRL